MSGTLTLLAEHGETLRSLLWVAVIASLVFGILRIGRKPTRAAASPAAPMPATETASLTATSQIERLFALIDGATQSAERALAAHTAAAKHLDSAEYQLLRLFEEFPMLAAARRSHAATAEIVRIAPIGARQALAA